jgi:hypothetical protein
MTKRRKKPVPIMLFWSKAEQKRFIGAVERLVGLVGDLEVILMTSKRRRAGRQSPATGSAHTGAAQGTNPGGEQ